MTTDAEASLTLDASDFIGSTNDAADSQGTLQEESAETQNRLFDFDAAGAAASGAILGIGTAMSEAVQGTQDMRSDLDRTAERVGVTSSEMNELARETSDATFPLEDASGALESLSEQGVVADDLGEVAGTMDTLADATGSSATSIADSAGPALRAFGHDLEDAEDHMDTFNFVAQNTSMDVEDFSGSIERMAPELQEMGVSLDDAAMYMAALEEEGITGRQAIQQFRQASNEADGDQDALQESLGLTDEQLQEQSESLEDAEGSTEKMAEAGNESLTTLDRMRQRLDEARLAAGDFLGPIDSMGPALQAAGGAALILTQTNLPALAGGFSGVMGPLSGVTGALGSGGVAGALTALTGPVGIAVAAIATLGTAFATDFGGIRTQTERVVGVLSEELQPAFNWLSDRAVPQVQSLGDTVSSFGARVEPIVNRVATLIADVLIVGIRGLSTVISTVIPPAASTISSFATTASSGIETVRSTIQSFRERVSEAIGRVQTTISTAREHFNTFRDRVVSTITDLRDRTVGRITELREDTVGQIGDLRDESIEFITTLDERVIELITGMVDSVVDEAEQLYDDFTDWISDTMDSVIETISETDVLGEVQDVIGEAVDWLTDDAVGDFLDAGEGLVDAIVDGIKEAPNAVKDEVENVVGEARDMLPFSDAKEGPFSDLTASGEAFPETVASGIQNNDGEVPSAAEDALSYPGVEPGMETGGSGPSNENPDGVSEKDLEKAVEKGMKKADLGGDLVSLLQQLLTATEQLDSSDVKQKDVLKALDVAEDRRSGRNPLA